MKLTMKEVAYIGRMYEGLSEISLLANLQEIEDGSELFGLMEKEVIVEDELSPKAREIMDVVASARACTRLFIKDRFCLVEKYVYRFNDQLVLVENDEGDMVFSRISDLGDVSLEVAELIGSSHMKSAELEMVLSHEELLVLLSVVDLYRHMGLKAYLGEETESQPIDEETVVTQLNNARGNSLAQLMLTNYDFKLPSQEQVKAILKSLLAKGCVANGQGYELSERFAHFAKGFLIPETLLTLESLNYDSRGELMTASSLCIGAGLRDLVFLAFGSEDVEIATVTGAEMLRLLENYLQCPSLPSQGGY